MLTPLLFALGISTSAEGLAGQLGGHWGMGLFVGGVLFSCACLAVATVLHTPPYPLEGGTA